ncbi:hypothetical protein GYMLUDRAFT_899492 [Collybiopsis luxurians FD-317 M1]|uniref:Uncharacterized protein n=1 Tax=Collybiopsis luxurians FD-317 M1 TaxID=944289 RepID=A0A0D0BXF9_9AGAR|nr:hypothetical protein GYMLUDRAFT_899492 [Collybiopsis luxurians FD-317 M1]
MSSREQAAANDGPTPMQLLHSRRKHQLHLRPLTNFVYFLVTRGLFFIGLSVVTRNLYSTFTHIKSEANSVIFSRYRSLHQNQTLDTVTDRGTVVQPLIGEAQLFDIGVTIWARATAEEEEEWRNSTGKKPNRWFPALVDGPIIMARDGFRGWFDSPSQISSPRPMISGESLFVPLHSDIAFKGLQLSDVRSTTVNFSLPRKYFLNERGYPMDYSQTSLAIPVRFSN